MSNFKIQGGKPPLPPCTDAHDSGHCFCGC